MSVSVREPARLATPTPPPAGVAPGDCPAADVIEWRAGDMGGYTRASGGEWLVSNGLGSYAAGTVALAATRRYHGLLVAALKPPVARHVLVAKCDVIIGYRGQRYALGANRYADGTVDPHGYRLLDRFALEGNVPCWTWRVADLVVRQRVWMAREEDSSYLAIDVVAASAPVNVTLVPFCAGRDYHALMRAHDGIGVSPVQGGCVVSMPGCPPCRLSVDAAVFTLGPAWHRGLHYTVERERGLDDCEDLFNPGLFVGELARGESVTLSCSIARGTSPAGLAWRRHCEHARAVIDALPPAAPWWVRRLALAADQFLVGRDDGHTVIAGYPWFTDWGRDTMIALPGLTLVTGRTRYARAILEAWAAHVSDGMLPNRFPDGGDAPEYNTVDATLWFFLAVDGYLARVDDRDLAAQLYTVLEDIARWHVRGTRHGIRVDPRDGLLAAGAPGTQLTWMDARADGIEVTPRHGKPVEINVLWQCALRILARLAAVIGDPAGAMRWKAQADDHAHAFRARYWHAEGWLYDVVDGPDGDDPALRPNQIFAIALAPRLLGPDQAAAVVDRCVQELWTPVGVRSLAPRDPRYRGSYRGTPAERDASYHQGTAWTWLLGPLARAHCNVHGNRAAAMALIEPALASLRHGALGTLGEIGDGDPPHTPRGCFAQAWSVATLLEAWHAIEFTRNSTEA